MAASTKQRHPAALAYASAMLQVGTAQGDASAYGDQLNAVANAISYDAQLRDFIESPKISRESFAPACGAAISVLSWSGLAVPSPEKRPKIIRESFAPA